MEVSAKMPHSDLKLDSSVPADSSSARRPVGRPRKASLLAEEMTTKARILARATELFARKGYEGTSVSDISDAAGVNKRMLYHYFGEKEGLYREVFIEQWTELKQWFDKATRERMNSGEPLPSDSRGLLIEALEVLFRFMTDRPQFVRLLQWDGLEGGEVSKSIWQSIRGPIYVEAEAIIHAAQEEGWIDQRMSAAHLIITFLGAVASYFAYAPTLADMLKMDPLSEQALSDRKQQLRLLLECVLHSQRMVATK